MRYRPDGRLHSSPRLRRRRASAARPRLVRTARGQRPRRVPRRRRVARTWASCLGRSPATPAAAAGARGCGRRPGRSTARAARVGARHPWRRPRGPDLRRRPRVADLGGRRRVADLGAAERAAAGAAARARSCPAVVGRCLPCGGVPCEVMRPAPLCGRADRRRRRPTSLRGSARTVRSSFSIHWWVRQAPSSVTSSPSARHSSAGRMPLGLVARAAARPTTSPTPSTLTDGRLGDAQRADGGPDVVGARPALALASDRGRCRRRAAARPVPPSALGSRRAPPVPSRTMPTASCSDASGPVERRRPP